MDFRKIGFTLFPRSLVEIRCRLSHEEVNECEKIED